MDRHHHRRNQGWHLHLLRDRKRQHQHHRRPTAGGSPGHDLQRGRRRGCEPVGHRQLQHRTGDQGCEPAG